MGKDFHTVVFLFFVDGSSRTSFLWSSKVCVQRSLELQVIVVQPSHGETNYEELCLCVSAGVCVLLDSCPVVGGGVQVCRLKAKFDISARAQRRVGTFHSPSVLRRWVTQIMGSPGEKTKDQSFPLYRRSCSGPLATCHPSEHQTTNTTHYILMTA